DWDAKYYTATVGLDFYLGSHDKHADWVDTSDSKLLQEEIDDLEDRLGSLEEDLKDDDKDGIPNYLDTEPNTPSGVMVDAKGRAIDKNNNGIPDEMEQTMDNSFVKVDGSNNQEFQNSIGGSKDMIIRLINDGFVNVYFDFNKDEITDYSYDSINFIRSFMMQHPDVNAELVGFADLYGNESYNNDLSERRAKKVFDILVSTGIDADRLTHKGGGVDNSVGKDTSNDERKVVRKVTFYLK
ncbi:MAG: OmpA family protein, partial [Psychroflexus maritimus]